MTRTWRYRRKDALIRYEDYMSQPAPIIFFLYYPDTLPKVTEKPLERKDDVAIFPKKLFLAFAWGCSFKEMQYDHMRALFYFPFLAFWGEGEHFSFLFLFLFLLFLTYPMSISGSWLLA